MIFRPGLLPALFIAAVCQAWAAEPVSFEIDPSITTGPVVSRMLYGMNVARWDHSLYPSDSTSAAQAGYPDRDADAIEKLAACRPGFLKYPGGNDADTYVWNSPANPAGDMDTTEFLHLAREVRAPGFLTVNFNQPPQLAADWVRFTNRARGPAGAAVPFWEVGDEVWGKWTQSHMPGEQYGRRFREFSRAMKAADPGIELAANLGLANGETAWTRAALRELSNSFDIVTMTYFPLDPPDETDEELFRASDKYRSLFRRLEKAVAAAAPGRRRPKYCLVGFNSTTTTPGPQTVGMANAIFMAQMYAALAETGTDMACWWALHNAWAPRGGDYGILTGDGKNTPHYTYRVFRALARGFHGRLVASRRIGAIEMYAVLQEEGGACVLIINPSPSPTPEVTLRSLPHVRPNDFVPCSLDRTCPEVIDSTTTGTRPVDSRHIAVERRPGSILEMPLGVLPPLSVTVTPMPIDIRSGAQRLHSFPQSGV